MSPVYFMCLQCCGSISLMFASPSLSSIHTITPQSLSDLLVGMPLFSDNLDTEAPYFLAMQEAAIDHTARACGDGERWTGLG